MNEAETRAELIDPALKSCGWGEIVDTKVFREFISHAVEFRQAEKEANRKLPITSFHTKM